MLTEQSKKRLEAVAAKLKEGIPPNADDAMWMFRCLREVERLPAEVQPKTACEPCAMRKKVILNVLRYVPEKDCGIPDAIMADYTNFAIKVDSGRPVVQLKYCPWCGGIIDPKRGLIITDVRGVPPTGPSAS